MGRVNKRTNSAFADLTGNEREVSAYDIFLNLNNPKEPSDKLLGLISNYREYIESNRLLIQRIGLVEELIMQLRTYENMDDIKISNIRNYIYARAPFYRKDIKTKDVRVIVDSTDIWNLSLDELNSNEEFMNKAKQALREKMRVVIDRNFELLQEINQKISAEITEEETA
jgi:hypothetical protein